MLNLAMLLDDSARKYPRRDAVVMGATRLTYAQLDAMACQTAHALRALGVRPGDRVALSCPNIPWFPVAYFGILKAGAVVVPLNVLLKGPEIAYHLDDSESRVYLAFEGSAELPMGRMAHEGFQAAKGCEHLVLITGNPAAPSPIDGVPTLGQLLNGQPATLLTEERSSEDTAVILYTSGTTGRPKGAELTHANMYLNAMVSRDVALPGLDTALPQVALIALPLFHSFGQTCQMNAGMLGAQTLVLVPRFEPGAVLELFTAEKVDVFCGVPTMYWALLNHARQSGVDTAPIAAQLKVCISGGSAMPVELLHAFEQTFDVKILEGYGLSETSPAAVFNHLDLPRKVGSIGIPVTGCQVKVVDETGNEVPAGERGELVLRGHNIMKGYYNKPEATAQVLRDGWFHSGDVAIRDDDGYFFIVDRLKDMIIRGGFNVYPREIEETLMTHPAVSLAAVVGIPDARCGEEVKAFIILKPDTQLAEDELGAWCRERMADYKYPRSIEFRASLPMTATGKILKRELRME